MSEGKRKGSGGMFTIDTDRAFATRSSSRAHPLNGIVVPIANTTDRTPRDRRRRPLADSSAVCVSRLDVAFAAFTGMRTRAPSLLINRPGWETPISLYARQQQLMARSEPYDAPKIKMAIDCTRFRWPYAFDVLRQSAKHDGIGPVFSEDATLRSSDRERPTVV